MSTQEYERHLHDQLRILHENYRKEAKPIIDRLIALKSLEPIPPVIINVSQLPDLRAATPITEEE